MATVDAVEGAVPDVLATDEARGLLEAGREAGSLSADEIALALDDLDLDAGQMDEFYAALDELHIDVVEADAEEEAQVAAAVGRYDKDAPQRAFSRLGPLVRVFPHAPTVRFHLGLLLLWLNQVEQAKKELRLARAEGPGTPIGKEADVFLKRLSRLRTR